MKNREEIAEEALKRIGNLRACSIAVTVSGGKTRIGIRHMNNQYDEFSRFLVVAPKKSIFQSWKDEIELVGYQHLLPQIDFSTYISLHKQKQGYNSVYLDEEHALKASHAKYLAEHKGKILGLTGSFPKSPESERYKMIQKYCPLVYRYKTDEAVEDKILNDYRIVVHYLDLSTEQNIKMEKGGKVWYTSERKSYEYWSNRIEDTDSPKDLAILRIMRMKALMGFPGKEVYAKRLLTTLKEKTIIFANEIQQAQKLCKYCYTSKNPDSEKNLDMFKKGEIMQMGSVLQLNEGINVPGLKNAVMLHSYSNSGSKFSQRLGRLFRLNPNDTCTLHVLAFADSIDSTWLQSCLDEYDETKIFIANPV